MNYRKKFLILKLKTLLMKLYKALCLFKKKDVLVEGKKFNQSQLNMTLELIKQRNPAVAKKFK